LTVTITVANTDIRVVETLRRDRARSRRSTANKPVSENWREELDVSVRTSKFFRESYGVYMDAADRAGLDEAIGVGERALEKDDDQEGKRAANLLRNSLFGSGTASQLFIAERVMDGAPTDVTLRLAEATARLREAHAKGDTRAIDALSAGLRVTVAQIMSQQAGIRDVADRPSLQGLLRVRE
jgi:hypothetical protein